MAKGDTPHDDFFKKTFADTTKAAAELASILPERDLFDWPTLRLQPGLLPDQDDANRFSDLLFSVRRADVDAEVLVYVLFEHQSSDDRFMLLRMLRYMLRVWETWLHVTMTTRPPLPPIVPVVLTHDERGWRSARHFHELFADDAGTKAIADRFLPAFEIAVDDLAKVSNEQLQARGLPPAVALSLWALRDGRSPDQLLAHAPFWAPSFAALEASPDGLRDVVQIFSYAGKAKGEHSVDIPALADRIAQHDPSAQHLVMNSLDKLIDQGRKEGLEIGLEKGRLESQRQTLRKLLLAKFGDGLSDADAIKIEQADADALDTYLERILTADSVAAALGSE